MFRTRLVLGSGLFITANLAQAAEIGVIGDGFDMGNPAYVSQLESSGHTFRLLENFESASFQGLDAVWMDGFTAYAFRDLSLAAPGLAAFVNNGGTLIVESPGFGLESIEEYPFAANLAVTSGVDSEATIRIRNPGLSLNDVTADQMSGWTQAGTSGNFTTITDWIGLTDNGTDGQWVTIERSVGQGTAVYTFQDMHRMMFEPKSAEAIAMLNSIVPVPEPGTVALVTLGAAALAMGCRRRK